MFGFLRSFHHVSVFLCIGLLLSFSVSFSSASSSSWLDRFLDPCAFNPLAINDLRAALAASLVGQELAVDATLDAVEQHINNIQDSTKSLVLSLHGMTGTGKTFMATTLAANLFASSTSSHIHHLHGKMFDNDRYVDDYKLTLHRTLLNGIQSCPYSLFIFEEIHYMHRDVLDHLIYFFDYHARIDQLDVTKAIYIFTSNIAGKTIQKTAYEAAKAGIPRNAIAMTTLSNAITNVLTHEHRLSLLIQHAIVNVYIPFFPLFKSHVKQCFHYQLQQRRQQMQQNNQIYDLLYDDHVLNYAASLLRYVGPISSEGCKPVSDVITSELLGGLSKQQRMKQEGFWGRKTWKLAESRVRLVLKDRNETSDRTASASVSVSADSDHMLTSSKYVDVIIEQVDVTAERKKEAMEQQRQQDEQRQKEQQSTNERPGPGHTLPAAPPVRQLPVRPPRSKSAAQFSPAQKADL